jgi:two-component system NtrC family sensor kinase
MKVKDHPQRQAMLDDALQHIEAQTLRCGQIVKSVLQFARQEDLQRWRVDLREIAGRARDLLRKLANQRRVSVAISPRSGAVELTANPLEMEQVLVNLVSNAIQASAAGGSVNVGLEAEPETVRLTIADRGCGMAREQIERMFDPFYSTRQQEGGMGLGLSVAYGVIKKQGGTIDVRSAPGQGTTVTVLLPRNLPASEGAHQ